MVCPTMKLIARIAFLLLACVMVLLTVDACRARSAPGRAKAIRIGDTKQQVRRAMGWSGIVTTAGIFNPSETWVYGGYVDWKHMMSRPVRIRIFGPDEDEVAIRFDDSGRVSRVIVPKQHQ